jgi:hypothetical protein
MEKHFGLSPLASEDDDHQAWRLNCASVWSLSVDADEVERRSFNDFLNANCYQGRQLQVVYRVVQWLERHPEYLMIRSLPRGAVVRAAPWISNDP